MISCFGNLFKPLGPNLSFLGTSLLAVTFTFEEAYVSATKRTYFSKTQTIIFLSDFGPDVCRKFALFGPAMKKKLRSNFPWLSMTKIKYIIVDVIYWKQNTQFFKLKIKNLVKTEPQNVTFSLVAEEVLTGLIYLRPSGENIFLIAIRQLELVAWCW